jgi:hypothetical protein
MKNAVFWTVTCGSSKNRRFGGRKRLHHQGDKNQRARNIVTSNVFLSSVLRLLVTDNVRSSPILVTLMMETILSFETPVLSRATRSNIQKTAFLVVHYVTTCYVCFVVVTTEGLSVCGSSNARHGAKQLTRSSGSHR